MSKDDHNKNQFSKSAAENIKAGIETGLNNVQGAFNEMQNIHLNKAFTDYSNGIKESISDANGNINNQNSAVKRGFVAEADHEGSFNVEAAAKGQNNHRATRNTGTHNDPVVDIKVTDGKTTTEYQSKYYSTAKKTAAAQSNPKYKGVEKLVPSDQKEAVVSESQRRSHRDPRPEMKENYQDTADRATDTIGVKGDRHKIRSKAKSRQEVDDMVSEVEKTGEGPEYAGKERVRAEFNGMQYRNAAKAGAVGGMLVGVGSEVISFLTTDKKLTLDECFDMAGRVIIATIKGAATSVAVTGLQHIGQSMIDAAVQQAKTAAVKEASKVAGKAATSESLKATIGKALVKGNMAATLVQLVINYGCNLYDFASGKIDGVELGSATVNGTVMVVGSTLAYGVGITASTYVGQFIGAGVANTAIFGTTLGALGPMVMGGIFSIAFALTAGLIVNHFGKEGTNKALQHIDSAMEQLNGGKINLTQYAGIVGTMSECNFRWTDIIPFSGPISVMAEYRTRKAQLLSVYNEMQSRIDALPEQERQAMEAMHKQFKAQIKQIDDAYEQASQELISQSKDALTNLRTGLNQHLEINYRLFASVTKECQKDILEIKARDLQIAEQRRKNENYKQQLEQLTASLEMQFKDGGLPDSLRSTFNNQLREQMANIVSPETGYDIAINFLLIEEAA